MDDYTSNYIALYLYPSATTCETAGLGSNAGRFIVVCRGVLGFLLPDWGILAFLGGGGDGGRLSRWFDAASHFSAL